MLPLVGRLLLLLLLACDWAADPCQGTSPFSRPFASTESFCHSLAHREGIRLHLTASEPLDLLCSPCCYDVPRAQFPSVILPPAVPLAPGRILYVLMSILR